MDVPLYAIALVVFGGLYLGLEVFLAYALIFTLFAMYLYLALRYENLPDGYPYGASDSLVTTTFIGVTWGIFTLLAPKSPIPFVGNGLTYATSTAVPLTSAITITVILLLGFLVVGSFIVPRMRERGTKPAGSGGGNVTVGAGGGSS
jgi:hypothetical protein